MHAAPPDDASIEAFDCDQRASGLTSDFFAGHAAGYKNIAFDDEWKWKSSPISGFGLQDEFEDLSRS